MYNKIYAVTFDDDFAKVTGTNFKLYEMLIAVMIDVIVVLAVELVGALLVPALIILPTLAAMQLCKSFKSVVIVSSIISVIGATLGILVAIVASTPAGCTIVAIDILFFVVSLVVRR